MAAVALGRVKANRTKKRKKKRKQKKKKKGVGEKRWLAVALKANDLASEPLSLLRRTIS